MRRLAAAALAGLVLAGPVHAGEIGDALARHLYDGTWREIGDAALLGCGDAPEADACFASGMIHLISAYERAAQALYRHGATAPESAALGMLLGVGLDMPGEPANPDPEPLTYDDLVFILEDFSGLLQLASGSFQNAAGAGPFVIPIDPLRVRLDLDGDGTAEADETLATLLNAAGDFAEIPTPDAPPAVGKTKTKQPDGTIGFDNADAIWLAGYTLAATVPFELLLSHDFTDFFESYLHRIFPKAGLPMQDHSRGGTLMMDPDSDAFIADLVAAIHTSNFPVTDNFRLSETRKILLAVTDLSRQNWEMILAETDDYRELLPSPSQTSLVPDQQITREIIDAWMATLDQIDLILEGELLLPHWRFDQGFNLKTYFETATRTDIVLLLTGQDALAYLEDGPIADAESFGELNRVMGDDWPFFAIWFN
jgi:hypothetical protein